MGLQVLLWTMTGFYMVVVHIDIIHGDHLVAEAKAGPLDLRQFGPPQAVLERNPGITAMSAVEVAGRTAWRVQLPQGVRLADPASGELWKPLDDSAIRDAAKAYYAGSGPIVRTTLLNSLPQEVQAYGGPLWQVEFQGWARPTLYLSPYTGELVTKRHLLWRVFDFAWMLHIMDYDERTDVNNPLLRVATWSAVLMLTTGAWLLWWSLPLKRKKKKRKTA